MLGFSIIFRNIYVSFFQYVIRTHEQERAGENFRKSNEKGKGIE